MKPVIGVPLRCGSDYLKEYDQHKSFLFMHEKIRRSIIKTGGVPFALTQVQDIDYNKTRYSEMPELTSDEITLIEDQLKMLDGIIISGGNKSTVFDNYLLKRAIEENIPILGICLGMQLMANYNRDYENLKNENGFHKQKDEDQYKHKVIIDKDSRLYSILGNQVVNVNSFHGYHVKESEIYKTVGLSEDGLIEAIEYPEKNFNIGLQWHPESMLEYDEDACKIMEAFMDAAKEYKRNKKQELLGILI